MSSITFDVLGYARQLKDAGVTDTQAEIIAKNTNDAIRVAIESAREEFNLNEVATKRDIRELEISTKRDIKELELKTEAMIERSKNTMLLWMFSMVSALAALMAKGFHWF